MDSGRVKRWIPTVLILGYALAVLTIDTLALCNVRTVIDWRWVYLVIDWGRFSFKLANGFDVYKFVAWFAIPFACCLPGMDWGSLGIKRWERRDAVILAALAGLGLIGVLAIPFIPALSGTFPSLGEHSWAEKSRYAYHYLSWTFSWILGWEFLHRYFILRHTQRRWPRYGWLIVPVIEGVYHLPPQQSFAMAFGMVVFSLLLTPWAVRRRNVLLPFLAHLIVELELLVFILVY